MEDLKDIFWLGHASFYFIDHASGQRIYYADPFELTQPELPPADMVFITHAHSDHFSPPALALVVTKATTYVAPPDILRQIEVAETFKLSVAPNQQYTHNNFSFSTIPAYNTYPEKQQFHPRSNNWVGYIFSLNGKKIYHAGDTDLIPEMESLAHEKLTLALLPIGGHYVMDVSDAIKAANLIKAAYTAPIHYRKLLGEASSQAEEQFKKGVTASQVVILPHLS